MPISPQDPYNSLIVRASAGSGKTYQLSRRFLNLVGAGADPGGILTITFTNKAASEMRERILQEAVRLLEGQERAQEFESSMQAFHRQQKTQLRPPRSAKETAAAILGSTQSLKITTIDSIFVEWIRKFPFEASQGPEQPISVGFGIAEERDRHRFDELAWRHICQRFFRDPEWKQDLPALSIFDIRNRIVSLQRHNGFLWYVSQHLSQLPGQDNEFLFHPRMKDWKLDDEHSFIDMVREELLTICKTLKDDKQIAALQAIEQGSIDELIRLKVLKANWQVSGTSFRGKKREQLQWEISQIDELSRQYWNEKRLAYLNQVGAHLYKLYQEFNAWREREKLRHEMLEFDDLTKGCFKLFQSEEAFGARYLIQRKTEHILLDEFQDTSLLQWSIFAEIVSEFFAGSGLEKPSGLPSTLFIVGDEKQSIYGFREADPRVLQLAVQQLEPRGVHHIGLNESYRTSQIILDFVNDLFHDRIPEFPHHTTARDQDNRAFVEDLGSIAVSPCFEATRDGLSAVEREAQFIARYLHEAIHGTNPLQIYDRSEGCRRPLQARDCAILYRSATHAAIYEQCLRHQGFETQRQESQGFFHRQEVLDLIGLLNFIAYPYDIESLCQVFRSPWSPFTETELNQALEKSLDFIDEDVLYGKRSFAILDDLRPRTEVDATPVVQNKRHFIDKIRELQGLTPSTNAFALTVKAMRELQILEAYEIGYAKPEAKLCHANLINLVEMIHQHLQNGQTSLIRSLQQLAEAQRQDDTAAAASSGETMTLMTIHKSKGLEFPLVVVAGCAEPWQKSDPYWMKTPPDSARQGIHYIGTSQDRPDSHDSFDGLMQQVIQDGRDENLRLLYVALTRSKHHLLITGHRQRGDDSNSDFLSQILDLAEKKDFQQASISSQDFYISYKDSHWQPHDASPLQSAEAEEQAGPLPTLESARAGAKTGIKTLAPARLLASHDKETSTGSGRFMGFEREAGVMIHAFLERHLRGEEPDLAQLWQDCYTGGAKDRFERCLPEVRRAIQDLLQSPILKNLQKGDFRLETEVAVVHLDEGMLIRGSIDLLIFHQNSQNLTVIDYKTTEDARSHPNLAQLIEQSAYDKQLQCYEKALQCIYPRAKINTAIWFTASDQLYYLNQIFADGLLIEPES